MSIGHWTNSAPSWFCLIRLFKLTTALNNANRLGDSLPDGSAFSPDMIIVTSSTSSASVKYFWIFECLSSSDDPLGGAGNPLSSIYFLIFVQLCK